MILNLLRNRRSARKFLLKDIEKDKLDKLCEAALRSPSSRNKNPWEFIFVTDKQKLKELSKTKEHGSAFLENAPLGIVVCADPEKCDVWVEDASIASTFLLLTAEDLGLGACWIQVRKRMHNEITESEKFVAKTLDIPNNLKIISIIAIGYRSDTKEGISFNDLEHKKIHLNKFSSKD